MTANIKAKISFPNLNNIVSVLCQKRICFECHSALDLDCPVLDTGESSISELDSGWCLLPT
jgi:hypothetical protein